MKYLSKEEYMPHAPDDVGAKVRVNHDSSDCVGSSESMVVERKHDGVYAKCFRCGKWGSNRETKPKHFFSKEESGFVRGGSGSPIKLPRDSEGDVRQWPSKARLWLSRARVTDEEARRYGINYSHGLGRVVLPVYSDGSMVGYQARKIFPEDTGPKYYTRTNKPSHMVFLTSHVGSSDTVVLCEDVLSAIRVGRFLPAGAILGTEVSDYALALLTDGKKYGIIYLDYDNRIVINKSIKLKHRLELLLDTVILISNGLDPKSLTDKELKEILL